MHHFQIDFKMRSLAFAALCGVVALTVYGKLPNVSHLDPINVILDRGGCGAQGPAPDLIGTRPLNWNVTEWVNSEPLRLQDLRGKVVLVRWFMDPSCPHCSATAPALREFHELYHEAGLEVIGMFHGSRRPLDEVRDIVRQQYAYSFPVAIDRETATRHEWTFGGDNCGYSDPYRSATFLLDRRGVVQHVHHEGQYVKGDLAYEEMRWTIERLLMDQERFDELFERIEKETSTEPEWAELELLTKAQQQVALVQIGAADAEVVGPPK